VISRRILVGLLAILAVLLVAFSVLMAFYLLTTALRDAPSTLVLAWASRVCGVLLIIDLILLIGATALYALRDR
jgi:predicted membrane-bound spermidine synthase